MTVLKKFGFGSSFPEWTGAVLQNYESCVIKADTAAPYFKSEEESHQGHWIPACLFILVLEISFSIVLTNENIQELNISNYTFLYVVYADDTTFFLVNVKYAMKLVANIDYF